MENIKSNKLLFLILLGLSSCYKFEARGFFTSYEDVNQRFEQSMLWNHKNGPVEINTAQESYTLHAMGDAHVGSTRNLARFFENAKNENTTALVMVGDLTTGHHRDYEVFSAHLPSKKEIRSFALVGNHDLYFDGWKKFYSLFGSSSYTFVVNTPLGSDYFICLDTGGGTLGSKQLEWLKKQLIANRHKYRHCIVFTHNNLIRLRPTVSTNPMVEEVRVLLDLSIKHSINMMVTGHDHKRNTTVFGNTTHIIMDALQDSNKQASYLKLTIDPKKINFSFVDL